MPTTPKKMTRAEVWLRLLPVMLLAVAFVAVKPWLLATIGGPALGWVGVAFVILVISYGLYVTIRRRSSMDEVEKAGDEFSARWGFVAGVTAFVLLFALPPFQDFVTDHLNNSADGPDAARKLVMGGMTIGICGVAIFQTISIAVMKAIWWRMRR